MADEREIRIREDAVGRVSNVNLCKDSNLSSISQNLFMSQQFTGKTQMFISYESAPVETEVA